MSGATSKLINQINCLYLELVAIFRFSVCYSLGCLPLHTTERRLHAGGGSLHLLRVTRLQIRTKLSAGLHPRLRETACYMPPSLFGCYSFSIFSTVKPVNSLISSNGIPRVFSFFANSIVFNFSPFSIPSASPSAFPSSLAVSIEFLKSR